MQKSIIEFLGTFLLAFVVTIAVGGGIASNLAPFAAFAALAAAIYFGGHISGGAFNPAVSTSMWMRKLLTPQALGSYWFAQIIAGVVAGLAAKSMPTLHFPKEAFSPDMRSAVMVEFIFTFFLCFTVLRVATAKATKGNSYYGVAIALVVLAGALSVGTVSSAVFNPAVGSALLTTGYIDVTTFFVYVAAQLAAAVIAGGLFRFTNPEDCNECTSSTPAEF
ncbi:MAG: porin [Phycisphaerales bacterium]|nr:porin [Phycisphaerales bacterium]